MPRTVKLKAGRNEFFVAFPASAPGWTGQYSFIEQDYSQATKFIFFSIALLLVPEDDGERHFPDR